MHVAIAAHDLYPDPGSGGTGRYVYETARRLADRGHRVSVVTRRRGDVPRRETVAGVEVYRYDIDVAEHTAPEILPQLPGAARAVGEAVAAIAAAGEPDLLSFQGPVTSLLAHRAVNDRVARSCTFHSPWPTEYRIRTRDGSLSASRRRLNAALRRRLEGYLLSHADDAITLSEFMRDRLVECYDYDGETTVIPGGVDTERFTPDAGSYTPIEPPADGTTTDETAFLTVRRLSPRMGHDLFLDAFARVVERRPDAHLYVAGDGPLRDDLEARAESLGVGDRTTFLGYVPDADLPAAYASADVFVLPTTELEGFGLATLEALASGTPVVGTPVGGTVEILADCADRDDVPAAMLVPRVETDALAECMVTWADLSADERAAAGRACRQYARERYTWERTADALESHYARRVRR